MTQIATDNPLSEQQQQALRSLVGYMIPADSQYEVPGADDPAIFAELLGSVARLPPNSSAAVAAAAEAFDSIARTTYAGAPGDLSAAQLASAIDEFRHAHPDHARALVAHTLPVYYRDDRVMESLGMEARAPFPQGHEVEQGDWSLLDPVRARAPFYRNPAADSKT